MPNQRKQGPKLRDTNQRIMALRAQIKKLKGEQKAQVQRKLERLRAEPHVKFKKGTHTIKKKKPEVIAL
jgi:hypothetical protein